jgi:hypothetical protein
VERVMGVEQYRRADRHQRFRGPALENRHLCLIVSLESYNYK